jgi:Outer membrane protein beta-barrel domain
MRKFFFIPIILLFSYNIQAQVSISRVKFGIQASPTFSWMSTSDNTIKGSGVNTGLRLGVTADYYFLENYAISTGLGFAFNQGGKLIHDEGGNFLSKSSTLSDPRLKSLSPGVKIRYHVQYLEVPIGLKLRTQQFGYLRAFAEAPVFTVGIKTQARGDIEDPMIQSSFIKEDIKSDVSGLAMSWGFGGGVQYDLSPSTAVIAGLYFQKGFIDATRDGDAKKTSGKAENSKGTIGNITLRIGVVF